MSETKMREAFKAHYGWDFSDPDLVSEAETWTAAWQAALAQAEQRGDPLTENYVQRVPDKCDRIVWRNRYYHLPIAAPEPVEQRGEVAGWLTDQGTFHFDKTDAWNDSEGFIEPLYAAPSVPVVPPIVAGQRGEVGPCGKSPCPTGQVCKSPFCTAPPAQAEQRGEVAASEWRKRFGENPLSSTRRSECDEYTWRLMVLCQDMMVALERAAAPPAPVVPPLVAAAARHFKSEGGHIGGLGASRAGNILWDYINDVLAAAPEVPK